MGRPPCGWFGRLPPVGCLVSLGFAVVYGGLMMVVGLVPTLADGSDETIDFSLSWRAGVLVVGVLATVGLGDGCDAGSRANGGGRPVEAGRPRK